MRKREGFGSSACLGVMLAWASGEPAVGADGA